MECVCLRWAAYSHFHLNKQTDIDGLSFVNENLFPWTFIVFFFLCRSWDIFGFMLNIEVLELMPFLGHVLLGMMVDQERLLLPFSDSDWCPSDAWCKNCDYVWSLTLNIQTRIPFRLWLNFLKICKIWIEKYFHNIFWRLLEIAN